MCIIALMFWPKNCWSPHKNVCGINLYLLLTWRFWRIQGQIFINLFYRLYLSLCIGRKNPLNSASGIHLVVLFPPKWVFDCSVVFSIDVIASWNLLISIPIVMKNWNLYLTAFFSNTWISISEKFTTLQYLTGIFFLKINLILKKQKVIYYFIKICNIKRFLSKKIENSQFISYKLRTPQYNS